MLNYKQNNLDNLIQKMSKNPSSQPNRSPNVKRQLIMNNKIMPVINKENERQRDFSPNKLNATRKPMITPSPTTNNITTMNRINANSNQQKKQLSKTNATKSSMFCKNHPLKTALFLINIDNEDLEYCEKCAAQLASQGFSVQKLSNSFLDAMSYRSPQKIMSYKPKQVPNYPEYQNNPRYLKIRNLLKKIYNLQQQNHHNIVQFRTFQTQFQHQIKYTQLYYQDLLELIQKMGQQHIEDLIEKKRKFKQVSDIQIDNIKDNLEELTEMRKDIQQNLDKIINTVAVQELNFNQCVIQYNSKLDLLYHKQQELHEQFKEVPHYSQTWYQQKIQEIIQYLKNLWFEQPEKENMKKKHPMSARQIHQKLPIMNKILQQKCEAEQSAFRSLFDDDNSLPVGGQISPQFKNI